MIQMSDLPASVQPIAKVIGVIKAVHLIANLPRTKVKSKHHNCVESRVSLYVPHELTDDHQLVSILGSDDAKRLSSAFGGEILYPGNCMNIYRKHRNERIAKAIIAGVSIKELAQRYSLSVKQVLNISCKEVPDQKKASEDTSIALMSNHFKKVADVIGAEKAFCVLNALPAKAQRDKRFPSAVRHRKTLWIPKHCNLDSKLVKLVGVSDACKLIQAFGGQSLYFYSNPAPVIKNRNNVISVMIDSGASIQLISASFKLSERQVISIRKKEAPDQRKIIDSICCKEIAQEAVTVNIGNTPRGKSTGAMPMKNNMGARTVWA